MNEQKRAFWEEKHVNDRLPPPEFCCCQALLSAPNILNRIQIIQLIVQLDINAEERNVISPESSVQF